MPEPEPYRQAVIQARGAVQEIDEQTARRILEALEEFADGLEGNLVSDFSDYGPGTLAGQSARERTAQIVRAQAGRLEGAIQTSVADNRRVTYERLTQIWNQAGVEAAESLGVDMATLGRVRGAPVSLLGVFENTGSARTWQTLIRGHVEDAASEANRILRQGFAEGVGPREMSRRLRRYVVGSEDFEDAFEEVQTLSGKAQKLDLRTIPDDMRGAAAQVEFNARRIAATEFQQARGEAEIQHFMRDPLVEGVARDLAPAHDHTDHCDVLASQDLYGMGPGVYPVGKAPPLAVHPFDMCSHRTVGRPPGRMDEPKPTPDRRVTDPEAFDVPGGVTEARAETIREQTEQALADGEAAWEEIQRRAA